MAKDNDDISETKSEPIKHEVFLINVETVFQVSCVKFCGFNNERTDDVMTIFWNKYNILIKNKVR